jgi:hypothetical protein
MKFTRIGLNGSPPTILNEIFTGLIDEILGYKSLFKVTNAKLCKPIFAQLVRKFSAFYET